MHEVNEIDGRLDDMLLRLGQVPSRVPTGLHEKEVMEAGVQLPVQLTEVLPPIALGDPMLFSLFVVLAALAPLALLSTQLLQRGFAIDVSRSNKGYYF